MYLVNENNWYTGTYINIYTIAERFLTCSLFMLFQNTGRVALKKKKQQHLLRHCCKMSTKWLGQNVLHYWQLGEEKSYCTCKSCHMQCMCVYKQCFLIQYTRNLLLWYNTNQPHFSMVCTTKIDHKMMPFTGLFSKGPSVPQVTNI